MKKIILAVLLALIMLTPVFAGGQQDAGAAAAPEKSGGLTPPETATVVNMLGWRYPITEFYAKELEKLNQVNNLRVNTQLLDSGSAREQAKLALSGGGDSPYEIIHTDDANLTDLASEGWLMPLDDLIAQYRDEYDLGDISDGMWKLGTYEGKVYGIPIIANSMNYFYNMELFEKYNLKVPETYDDVIATAKVLKQEASLDLPFTINLHAGWAWRIEFRNFLKGYGGEFLNEDNTPAFNGPEGVKAVEKMVEVYKACMGDEGLTWSIDDTEIGLETGTLASAVTWTSRAANMDDPAKSRYVGKIGFAPAPRLVKGGPHAGPAAADFYVIPKNVKVDPELLFQIIMQVADLESQMRAADYGMVTRNAVAEAGAGGRYLDAALKTIANGAGNYGPNPAVKIARTAIENVLPTIVRGDRSAQEVLDEAAELYIKEAKAQGYLK